MAIEALEGVTDQDLFDGANADEAADEAVVEVPEAPEVQDEQPRDEEGRFAAKQDEPEKPVVEVAEKPAVDDNAPQVPSWRVREINDEKRVLAERVASFESQQAQWQREQQELRQRLASLEKPAAEVKAEEPDPLLDPKAYREFIREETRQEILNDRREASLANAHRAYKGEFEEAYAAAQKQVDPVLKMRMQNSRDPGETLIEWHREQKTRAEVGSDPNAYFDKRFEAYLADPANQAKVLERIRGGVQPQQPGARPAVSLPPSLTRTAAAAEIDADDNDVSNDGLWRHANA